jgi:hypothetical protein
VLAIRVPEPFRLDLTANVLRRLSTNVVDRFQDGHFQRLLGDADAGHYILDAPIQAG